MRAASSSFWIAIGLCSFQLASCSSDDSSKKGDDRDGGDASSGGAGSGGAAPRTGGVPGAGGRVGTGGAPGTGGAATGGAAAGGAAGAGGDGAGGVQGAGGTGGVQGAGGAGGVQGTGGDGAGGAPGVGGATDAGPGDASITDASSGPDTSACAPCPSGLCLEAGLCAECARDEHCSGATPRCTLDTYTCVPCLPDPGDNCPANQFCDPADLSCKPGCKGNADCASGVCGPAHDCARCVSDLECAGGRVCSSGECLALCSGTPDSGAPDSSTPDSGTPDCPPGFACCGTRCALFTRDFQNCGGCGASCVTGQYCGARGCLPNTLATICDALGATFLLDGLSLDDAMAPIVSAAFETGCPFAGPIPVVSQDATSALNPDTGRPVAGPGELYVTLGGPFGQKLTRYLETSGLTRVYDVFLNGRVWFYGRSADGGPDPVIVEAGFGSGCEAGVSCLGPGHDYFRVESVVDPVSGTRTLQIYGMDAAGTGAAAWFFENRMLPQLTTFDRAYYVYEWIDDDGTQGPSGGDTFRLIESGS